MIIIILFIQYFNFIQHFIQCLIILYFIRVFWQLNKNYLIRIQLRYLKRKSYYQYILHYYQKVARQQGLRFLISLQISNSFGAIKKSIRITGYDEKNQYDEGLIKVLEEEMKSLNQKVVYRGYDSNYMEVHFVDMTGKQQARQKIKEIEQRFNKALTITEIYDNDQQKIKTQTDKIDKILNKYTYQEKLQLVDDMKRMALEKPEDLLNMLKSYPMMNYTVMQLLQDVNNK